MELMHNLWNPEDQRLLERLKKYISSGTDLEIPYPSRIFNIKTDWFKDVIGLVLLKANVSEEAINSESQEKDGGKC